MVSARAKEVFSLRQSSAWPWLIQLKQLVVFSQSGDRPDNVTACFVYRYNG